MRRAPVRWLLLGPIVLTLSLGALALGFFVQRSVGQDLLASVDIELTRVANGSRGPVEPVGDPTRPLPERPEAPGPAADQAATGSDAPLEFLVAGDGTTTLSVEDALLFDEAELADLFGTRGNRTIEGAPRYRIRTSAGPGGRTAVVALPLELADETISSLRQNLLVGGLVLFGVQVLAVWFIAGAVARPVTRMSTVAHRIAEGDLEAAVGPPNGSQETADLAVDLGRMLDRLKSTIADEQQSTAAAIEARGNMERFMADASHELRTPLTALKGYSDLYRGGMLDEEGLDRAMDRIGSESERLTELVVGLLNLTKENAEVKMEPVDLSSVLLQATSDVRAAHPNRTISLPAQCEPVLVVGDENRLHQAMLNLLSNACQHTAPDSPVHALLDSGSGQAHVSIVDHGPGIPAADRERVFVAFARGDESRSRKSHDGAGLGLALVRRIAEQHDGSAWVRDTPGGGATFGMTLPQR